MNLRLVRVCVFMHTFVRNCASALVREGCYEFRILVVNKI